MSPQSPLRPPITPTQLGSIWFVALACASYLLLSITAPPAANANPYHLSIALIIVVGLSITALLVLCWLAGLSAWLQLDRYAHSLSAGTSRRAFGQIASGVRFLVLGLILSSLLSASGPFYAGDVGLASVVTQINYYVIILFPFLGFVWLRLGSKDLAVSAQAAMSLKTKLIIVGPPVLFLGVLYAFLAATNSTPDTQILLSGPTGFLVLPANIIVVISSWVLGLLAALNIERSTHHGRTASGVQPLVKLYNGTLLMTGGFIILDAILSLGTTRLLALPVSITILLAYAFVAVVALGFKTVAMGAKQLAATASKDRG